MDAITLISWHRQWWHLSAYVQVDGRVYSQATDKHLPVTRTWAILRCYCPFILARRGNKIARSLHGAFSRLSRATKNWTSTPCRSSVCRFNQNKDRPGPQFVICFSRRLRLIDIVDQLIVQIWEMTDEWDDRLEQRHRVSSRTDDLPNGCLCMLIMMTITEDNGSSSSSAQNLSVYRSSYTRPKLSSQSVFLIGLHGDSKSTIAMGHRRCIRNKWRTCPSWRTSLRLPFNLWGW